MLYSPIHSDEEDDFSHLPTVDGAAQRGVAPEVADLEEAFWGDSTAAVPDAADLTFEAPDQLADPEPELPAYHSAPTAAAPEDSPPPHADAPSEAAPAFLVTNVRPVDHDEPEQPADNSESIQDAKKRALIWAAGAHLIGLLILAIVQVKPAPQAASEIVAINSVDSEQTPAWKKVAPPAPAAAAAPSMQPLVAMGTSAVVMPDVDFSPTATELNVGSSFGTFGGGSSSAGGAVSFLGNQGKGNHMVFVVDVSGSMSASAEVDGKIISRMDLLKKELSKSIGQLRGNVQYQIIYFSHFAWPHNEVDSTNSAALAKYEWTISPGQTGVRIPSFRYLAATPNNLANSRKIIAESENPGGTNWGAGLHMALNGSPKPDLIFFMTDGVKSDATGWVEDVTAANARKGKPSIIHTTALMSPSAAQDLDELARRNGGKFTVVMADGKVIKSSDFFKTAAE
jgi:hypothetical protein